MSEYQYYEFAAIDRPLTSEQMSRLRALSTRATITPTRFCNFYTWGAFKGDPLALMEEYFDCIRVCHKLGHARVDASAASPIAQPRSGGYVLHG